jgi:C4-dicarboxylate-specific signal transduction histidine kinase
MNMGKQKEGSGGRTTPKAFSMQRALLRKLMDNYYGLYLLKVIEGVVHNLNGPLQIVYIRSEQLQQSLQKLIHTVQSQHLPEIEDLLSGMKAKMESSLSSLDDLSEQIKHLTSDFTSEACSAVEDININEVIDQCLFLMNADMFFKHSVSKTVKLQDDLPTLKGRKTDFSIVMLSILQNAAEAMTESEERHVTIKTSSGEDVVLVTVQDSGCGISEKERERMYELCYTTKKHGANRDEPLRHAGLGLCLVSLVLEKYEGSIVCESIPGKTVFTVRVPLNADSSD